LSLHNQILLWPIKCEPEEYRIWDKDKKITGQ
jgi:hypothetical protein